MPKDLYGTKLAIFGRDHSEYLFHFLLQFSTFSYPKPLKMKHPDCNSSGHAALIVSFLLCVLMFTLLPETLQASPHQIPLKEMFGKKPMKIDSALKSKAVQVKVRKRNGFSSMIRYNYDEYTTEDVSHKPTSSRSSEYGFIVYSGKSSSKTGFSYMLTDHKDDTVWMRSTLATNSQYTRAYMESTWSETELEIVNKSKDIYSSNLVFNNDTSKWEIIVLDRPRFKDDIQPVVVGQITNKERKMQIRLVADLENGDKAKHAPPGFEIIENGNALMAVQFLGYPQVLPVMWIDPGVDHQTRFVLIAASSSLISRLIEIYQMNERDMLP